MKRNEEITAAVILGGISEERPVSLETGRAVFNALKRKNFNVKLIDPALGEKQHDDAENFFSYNPENLNKRKFFETFQSGLFNEVDVAFIALHGLYGEDGTTQTLLDLLNVPFVGAGAFASAIGMNKYATKIMSEKAGVIFPEGILAKKNDFDMENLKRQVTEKLGDTFVVKPNKQGSSFGLSVCNGIDELEKALEKGFEVDDELLIEEFIGGRELTVSVLFDEALPVLEIVPESGLYDYKAKYESENTEYIVPANIEKRLSKQMRDAALKVFNAIGCKDYARVDFRLNDNNEFYCLEINTLPGMTSHSLLPKAA